MSLEGRAGKVSRKQAKLELKCDGCFYLRNLGTRLVYVNNMQLKKVCNCALAVHAAKRCRVCAVTLVTASQPVGGADTHDDAAPVLQTSLKLQLIRL